MHLKTAILRYNVGCELSIYNDNFVLFIFRLIRDQILDSDFARTMKIIQVKKIKKAIKNLIALNYVY